MTNQAVPAIDGDVEILDAKRIVFLKRVSDGAVYGETRYQIEFPNLNYADEADQRFGDRLQRPDDSLRP